MWRWPTSGARRSLETGRRPPSVSPVMTIATTPWTVGRPALRRGGFLSLPHPTAYGAPGPYVYDTPTARHIPAVGRAIQLYAGLCKQMPLEAYRGFGRIEPNPRILARPDPDEGGPWFVQVNVEDYLLNGNAISLVTSRAHDGWPLTVAWLPVNYVTVSYDPNNDNTKTYAYLGETLKTEDVIHVKRGADRMYPVRGVGIVEEHSPTLDRVAMEEEYERGALSDGRPVGRRHCSASDVESGSSGRSESPMGRQVWRPGSANLPFSRMEPSFNPWRGRRRMPN